MFFWWWRRQLKSADGAARKRAVRALGRSRDPRALPLLVASLLAFSIEVAREALQGIAALGGPSALTEIIVALAHAAPVMRDDAVKLLAERFPAWRTSDEARRALPRLVALVQAGHDEAPHAARVLGEMGDPAAIPALLEAWSASGHYYLSGAAKAGLVGLRDVGSAKAVSARLLAPNADHRGRAAELLGELPSDEALAALLATLRSDSEAAVRTSAAGALLQLADERAVAPLLAAASRDPDATVRATILSAGLRPRHFGERREGFLWRADADGSLRLLVEAAADSDSRVREEAIAAMEGLRDHRILTPLVEGLLDSDRQVRNAVASNLREWDPSWRSEAVARNAVPQFLAALEAHEGDRRAAGAVALCLVPDPRALARLIAALGDPEPLVRSSAAHALGELGEPAAIPALRACLKDTYYETGVTGTGMFEETTFHYRVREAAEAALRRLVPDESAGSPG